MTSHPRQRAIHQPSTQSSAPIRDANQPTEQLEAIMHLKAGRLDEATAALERVIAEDPGNWQSHQLLGLVAYRQGDCERAVQCIRHCLTINPVLAEAYSDLGVVLKDMGNLDDALAACEKAISLKPVFYPAHNNLGNIYKALRKLDDAADCYNRAIELSPVFADAYANLGAVLLLLDRKEDAIDACLQAVELAPNNADALTTFAQALLAIDEIDDAIAICQRAVELRPNYGPAFSDLGRILQRADRFDEAIAAHKQALALKPDHAEAHNNLGIVYKDLARYPDALRAYRSAIELKPDYADAYSNMGVVLGQMGHGDDAIRACQRALEIDPELLVAYINLAGAYSEKDRLSDAIATYAKALTIDPDHPSMMVDHYHLRRQTCDWDGLAAAEQKILASTFREGRRVAPFPILNMSSTAEDHLLAAREWVKGIRSPVGAALEQTPPRGARSERRLRIGYLSNDFCRHATSSLIAELIERHDRTRFEVFGYCFTRDDDSDMRHRLVAAFDHFVTIGDLSHADAAARINEDRIDILIDLKGFTTGARTEILACRPAPIQINYLGYPATMGAGYIDYIIADEFILPMNQQPFFDERIVHLPGCYQPNDSKRRIAEEGPTRAACGLPEDAFVFCSFNNSYKITPGMFSIWMRLLQNAPGSVLWLLESNSLMRENLRRKAASLSVDPARLVFAPKIELSQHLARHRLADLFLDSLPVNAHTTASDALWAGVPVLTCSGETFISRVCGSLLKAVGLGELITYSLSHYERLALDLARNPGKLARLRNELAQNRTSAPLFDMERYRQGFEAALEHMAELRERGDEPRAFAVNEDSNSAPEAETEVPAPATKAEREIPVIAAAFETAAPMPMDMACEPATASASDCAAPVVAPVKRVAYEACPLCNSGSFPVFLTTDCSAHPLYNPALPPEINWCRCTSCGHVFTDGYFAPEDRMALFGEPVPYQTVGHDAETQRFMSSRIVSQIAKLKPGGDWLDLGVGNGSLLLTAEEWGYRPVGIDRHSQNVEMLQALGYEAWRGSIEELDMSGRFSVISMSDILARMPDPRAVLSEAKRLLKPGGILFCATPNMASIVWRIMDSTGENPYWDEIEHYHNFTRERLYALLDATGFRPVFYNVSERYRACMDVIAMND